MSQAWLHIWLSFIIFRGGLGGVGVRTHFKTWESEEGSRIDFSFLEKPCQETNLVNILFHFLVFISPTPTWKSEQKTVSLFPASTLMIAITLGGQGDSSDTEVRQMKLEGAMDAALAPDLGPYLWNLLVLVVKWKHPPSRLWKGRLPRLPVPVELSTNTLLSGDERKLVTAVLWTKFPSKRVFSFQAHVFLV